MLVSSGVNGYRIPAEVLKFDGNVLVLKVSNGNAMKVAYDFRKTFSFYKEGYQWVDSYKNGEWDGKVMFGKMLLNKGEFIIPLGMLSYARSLFNFNFQLPPIPQEERFPKPSFLTLRDYQEEAVSKALNVGRGVIKLPTGSGKTIVAFEIMRRTKVPTLYIVHRKDLLYQTIKEAEKYGFSKIGVIGAGEYTATGDIDFAMIQSLIKIEDFDPSFFLKYKMLIFDECHHVNFNASSTKKVLTACRNAIWRFGFSATPFRFEKAYADDISLIALIGDIIYENFNIPNFLSPVKVIPVEISYSRGNVDLSIVSLSYKTRLEIIKNSLKRKEIIKELLEKHKKDKVLLIAPSVEHCKELAEFLNLPYVYGELDKKERKRLYDEFRNKSEAKLVATNIYDEGVDFPDLDVLIFTEPFKSYLKLVQRVGRGRRIAPGKECLLVYDIMDKLFARQNKSRKHNYEKEGFEISSSIRKEVKI